MKDPADRFQSCEELVAAIQGQPIAAAGSVRASLAAAGVAIGVGPTSPSPVVGAPPLIVSQPTTPLESPLVDRRATPRERRDLPRRVADRSVAMRSRGSSSWAWLWVVLAVLGGAGAAFYYYQSRGFVSGPTATPDSAATAPVVSAPVDPIPPPADPVQETTSTVAGTPAAPAPSAPRPASRPPARVPADSGSVRVSGLPRGSTVMIDEVPVSDPITRLPAGQHVLAVSAPRFNFYSESIVIRAGDTLSVSPRLTPIGAPAVDQPSAGQTNSAEAAPTPDPAPPAPRATSCVPGAGYNRDGSCFDERPKPVSPPYVPVSETVQGTPRPSIMWVKVSTEGRTLDVRRLRPSNDEAFEVAALDLAWSLSWHPAVKDGAPVEAWTQMIFPPQPASEPQ